MNIKPIIQALDLKFVALLGFGTGFALQVSADLAHNLGIPNYMAYVIIGLSATLFALRRLRIYKQVGCVFPKEPPHG